MDIGVKNAIDKTGNNAKLIFALDNNPVALATYKSYEKSMLLEEIDYTDLLKIQDLKGKLLCDDIENVPNYFLESISCNILIGGPPCQDYTNTRNGNGKIKKTINKFHMDRKNLYKEYLRFLTYIQPEMFIFENVLGIRNSNDSEISAFNKFLTYIQNIDTQNQIYLNNRKNKPIKSSKYKIIHSKPINMKYFGVPQERKRIFIIGINEDKIKLSNSELEFSSFENFISDPNNFPSFYPLTPIEIFEGKPMNELQNEYTHIMEMYSKLFKNNSFPNQKMEEYHKKFWLPSKNNNFDIFKDYFRINNIKLNENFDEIKSTIKENHKYLLQQLKYDNKPVTESNLDHSDPPISGKTVKDRMENIPPNGNWEHVENTEYEVRGTKSFHYRRLHPLKPSYTILSGKSGGGSEGYHYDISRQKLSYRELARLQTFPDDLVFAGTSGKIRTQIGEAVPPFGLENIMQKIIYLLDKKLS